MGELRDANGATVKTYFDQHYSSGLHTIFCDMDGLVSGANERAVVRLGQFVTAALAIVIMLAAIQFVSVTIQYNETNQVVGWPLWPIQMALPVGFGVAALRHLIYGIWPDLIPTAKVTE